LRQLKTPGGDPSIRRQQAFDSLSFVASVRPEIMQRIFNACCQARRQYVEWHGSEPPHWSHPQELEPLSHASRQAALGAFAVFAVEGLAAVGVAALSYTAPILLAGTVGLVVTVALALIAAAAVALTADHGVLGDPHRALATLRRIVMFSLAAWTASIFLVLLTSRVGSDSALLLAAFHASLLLLTLSTPALGGALLFRSQILGFSRRTAAVFDHLCETNATLKPFWSSRRGLCLAGPILRNRLTGGLEWSEWR
jgi:hypothetical protein